MAAEAETLIPQIDVKATLDMVGTVMGLLEALPLKELLTVVSQTHSLAPILDPTAYRDMLQRRGGADDMASVVRDLLPAVERWRRIKEAIVAAS